MPSARGFAVRTASARLSAGSRTGCAALDLTEAPVSMTSAQQNTAFLMRALHFNADELLLNRQGRLSPAQAQRIGGQLRAGSAAMWKIALFVLIIFVVGFAAL